MKKVTLTIEERRSSPFDKSSYRTVVATTKSDLGIKDIKEDLTLIVKGNLDDWEEQIVEDNRISTIIQTIKGYIKAIPSVYGTNYYQKHRQILVDKIEQLPVDEQDVYFNALDRYEASLSGEDKPNGH
jgi:hypothetical protein